MALKTKAIKKTAEKITKIAVKKAKSAANDVADTASGVVAKAKKATAPKIKVAKKKARATAKDVLKAASKQLKKAAKAL
jgi:hypothetical protein